VSGYWRRLQDITAERGPICVGIDPHPALLQAWGLSTDATGLESFSRRIVEALGDQVTAFKPQSAFFESHGSAGIAVLERLLADIAGTGALSIVDAKRGDIGSTMEAYADAYLADGSPLAADAVTLSPYLGFGSLAPAFERAQRFERGVYVLARTSNPEGGSLQLALTEEGSVVQSIIDAAADANRSSRLRAIGVVVGGTHESLGCDLSDFNGSILVPGIGFQGGRISDLPALFGEATDQVLAVVGRGVIGSGPDAGAMRGKVDALLAEAGR
jgi:orotidine-5'-phosphate decarboxylase